MRRRKFNFRFHLGMLGALTAVPFILAGAVLAILYVNSERQRTEQDLVTTAKDLSNAIDRQVTGGVSTLKTLAFSPALAQSDLASFYEQARQVAGIFPGSVVGFRRADGQQLINTALPWGAPLPRTQDPVLQASDKAALTTMQPVVSNIYTGISTGQRYVMLNLPVMLAGAPHFLNMAIPPESILRLVQQSSVVRPDWLVIVIDANRRVIARTRDHDNFVGRSASDSFVQKLAGTDGVVTSTTLDGTRVVDGYFRSPLTGWTVITAVPVATINESLRQAAIAVAATGVIGMICSIVFAILYSRYITPPIWRLRGAALALSRREKVAAFNTGITELNAVSNTLAEASASLVNDEMAKSQMMKELNHRVKNTLATVLSIARQTGAKADDFSEFFDAFSGRLVALAQSHDALSEGEWIEADIRELVRRVCTTMAEPERIRTEGPPVPLHPRAALTMGMVLHELSTNAAKYGALASTEGTIAIEWSVQPHALGGPLFAFDWTEQGGPPVTEPERKSFGTRFITDSIHHELKGSAEFDFRPEGLVFRCRFPLRPLGRGGGGAQDAQAAEPSGQAGV
jgi:two-component sensor histidine kinase